MDTHEITAVQQIADEDAAARIARVSERANQLREAEAQQQRQAKLCSQLGIPAWSDPPTVAAAWNARKGEVLGAVVSAHRFDELVQRLGLQRDRLGPDSYSTVWTVMVQRDHPWLRASQNKATGELVLPPAAPATAATPPAGSTIH